MCGMIRPLQYALFKQGVTCSRKGLIGLFFHSDLQRSKDSQIANAAAMLGTAANRSIDYAILHSCASHRVKRLLNG